MNNEEKQTPAVGCSAWLGSKQTIVKLGNLMIDVSAVRLVIPNGRIVWSDGTTTNLPDQYAQEIINLWENKQIQQ